MSSKLILNFISVFIKRKAYYIKCSKTFHAAAISCIVLSACMLTYLLTYLFACLLATSGSKKKERREKGCGKSKSERKPLFKGSLKAISF